MENVDEEPNINDSGVGSIAGSSHISLFSPVYFDAFPLRLGVGLGTLDYGPGCCSRRQYLVQ